MTQLYLIDSSAQARINHPPVRSVIATLVADSAAATCVTVDLELGYSGRDGTEVRWIVTHRRDLYTMLPINEQIADRAREVQVRLARQGQHRSTGLIGLLTAAVAEFYDAVLLHYDSAFEQIAEITGQSQTWICPPGTLT